MAKKSRRAKRKRKGRHSAVSTATRQPSPSNSVPPVSTSQQARPDFHEYQYVIADLRRVAILAAAMFGLLIVLSFLIR